jgi:hypothetical protein
MGVAAQAAAPVGVFMSKKSVVTVDLDEIDPAWFNDTRSYRATVYACRHYNRMANQAEEGYTFFDSLGRVDVQMTVTYGPNFSVAMRDGEGAWVTRIGDVRHEKSLEVVLSKKRVNEWLAEIRYIDPKHLKRIRLG